MITLLKNHTIRSKTNNMLGQNNLKVDLGFDFLILRPHDNVIQQV